MFFSKHTLVLALDLDISCGSDEMVGSFFDPNLPIIPTQFATSRHHFCSVHLPTNAHGDLKGFKGHKGHTQGTANFHHDCLGQISKTNTSPPKKKNWPSKKFKIFYVFSSFRKNHITTVVRGFQFFMIGIRQSQQGKIWPSPRSSTGPTSSAFFAPATESSEGSERKSGAQVRTLDWRRALKQCEAKAGQLGWGGFKTLPPRITSGVEVLLENLWGVT